MSMSCECYTFSCVFLKMLHKEGCFFNSNKRYRLSRAQVSISWWFQCTISMGFIAALNCKKTIHCYYFNNNCYNRTFVHIIRTVIFELPGDKWVTCQGKNCCLNPRRCAIWSMSKVSHWKFMEVYSLLLSCSTREPIYLYIKCVLPSWIDWCKSHFNSK